MTARFGPDVLELDLEAEATRISRLLVDAVAKLHRRGLIVALSGGIDSSTSGALAARALGPDKVLGLLLPDRESSAASLELGRAVAETCGFPHLVQDITPTLEAIVALLGGTIAAGSHLTKASTRVAANASPEPFSNWILSFLEDAFVVGLGVIALKYPLVALFVTVVILVTIALMIRWIVGKLRLWWRPAPTPTP